MVAVLAQLVKGGGDFAGGVSFAKGALLGGTKLKHLPSRPIQLLNAQNTEPKAGCGFAGVGGYRGFSNQPTDK